MALQKTIAAYRNADGSWTEQVTIDMHPLEETMIQSYWAMGRIQKTMPEEPSTEEKVQWLIDGGQALAQQKIAERTTEILSIQSDLDNSLKTFKNAELDWNNHVENSLINGVDPNAT